MKVEQRGARQRKGKRGSAQGKNGCKMTTDKYRIHIMVISDGVSLQLCMYEKIFVSQADSASCQVMITTTITRGVANGEANRLSGCSWPCVAM